jgi:hypothetical protein
MFKIMDISVSIWKKVSPILRSTLYLANTKVVDPRHYLHVT